MMLKIKPVTFGFKPKNFQDKLEIINIKKAAVAAEIGEPGDIKSI